MFFKNMETGLIHEVTNEDHINRCLNDLNYEEVKPKKEVEISQEEKKVEVKPKATNKRTSAKK